MFPVVLAGGHTHESSRAGWSRNASGGPSSPRRKRRQHSPCSSPPLPLRSMSFRFPSGTLRPTSPFFLPSSASVRRHASRPRSHLPDHVSCIGGGGDSTVQSALHKYRRMRGYASYRTAPCRRSAGLAWVVLDVRMHDFRAAGSQGNGMDGRSAADTAATTARGGYSRGALLGGCPRLNAARGRIAFLSRTGRPSISQRYRRRRRVGPRRQAVRANERTPTAALGVVANGTAAISGCPAGILSSHTATPGDAVSTRVTDTPPRFS